MKSYSNKINKLSTRRKDNVNKKEEETDRWFKESLARNENLLSTRNYWRRNNDKNQRELWQVSRIKILNLQLIKESLTGSYRLKELKKRRNNKKNGKKDRKPESTYSIKFMTIDNVRLKSTRRPRNKSFVKRNKINLKFKKESSNMSLNKKLVAKENMKDPS